MSIDTPTQHFATLAKPQVKVSLIDTRPVSLTNGAEPDHYAEPDDYRLDPHDTLPYDWMRKHD